jgi:RNA polymerase sigma factor (sigma-70 family)
MAGRRGRVIDLRDQGDDDAQLLARVRQGDGTAYGELWKRHAANARRIASRLVPRDEIDDLVSEAFERTLAAIRSGHGPVGPFLPYVAQAMRGRAATMLATLSRVTLAGSDEALDSAVEDVYPFPTNPARDRVLQAFRDLPPRWQDALWVSVVESEPPRRVAALLGTSPNGVSAMVIRARRRLRANFIDLSVAESRDPMCRKAIQSPDRYEDHLRTCSHCEATLDGLADLDVSLRAHGSVLVGLLTGLLTHVAAPHRRLRDALAAVPAKAAVAAVVVAGAAGAAGPFVLSPSSDDSTGSRAFGPAAVAPARSGRPPESGPLVAPIAAAPTLRAPSARHAAPTPPTPHASPTQPDTTATAPAHRLRHEAAATILVPATTTTGSPTPASPGTARYPAPARHPVKIMAVADPTCGCARITIIGVRRTDRIVVRQKQRETVGTTRLSPARAGTFEVSVFGQRGGSGRLVVEVTVTRANGRTIKARVAVSHPRTGT